MIRRTSCLFAVLLTGVVLPPETARAETTEQELRQICTAVLTIADGVDGPAHRAMMASSRSNTPLAAAAAEKENAEQVRRTKAAVQQGRISVDQFVKMTGICAQKYNVPYPPTTVANITAVAKPVAVARPAPTQAMRDEVTAHVAKASEATRDGTRALERVNFPHTSRKTRCMHAKVSFHYMINAATEMSTAVRKAKAYNLDAKTIAKLEELEQELLRNQQAAASWARC